MNNAATGVNIPLSTFGGLSTELSPTDLPEGGSPDNQDCAFLPGSVLTRPGMKRLYATPPTSAAIVYEDTFTRKDGTVFNVLMDADGVIWAEDFTNSPTVFTQVGSVPAGSRCKSVSDFGRLFMAFNDGIRGTDLPRSFDGRKWNRVSQGGSCGNPSFSEFIGASSTLAAFSSGASASVTSLSAADPTIDYVDVWIPKLGDWEQKQVTVYATIAVAVSSVTGFVVGAVATISGNTGWNGSGTIDRIVGSTVYITYWDQKNVSGTGGTIAVGSGTTLSRASDVVTAGTSAPHGLNPGDMFTVSGVANTSLGSISAVSRVSNVITVTTSADNGVRVGSLVVISGVTDTSFNGTWEVTGVVSSTQFIVESSNLADATSSGGTVYGQWNNTKRFVVSTPTSTTLTYNDPGPDAQTTSSGTISPVGQVAGGERNAVCIFLTDYGFRTPPSIPIKVVTSGGKKLVANNIPVGPSNVVARIIAFTAVDGSAWRYIPVPVRNNGNVIGSSTVINDNTSTSAIFDFSDDALLSGLAIDIDGANLFNLKILGNCSGVASYADRMWYWGDENKAINFLNMGFEGGINADGSPMGWSVSGSGLSIVAQGDFGDGAQFAAGSAAILSQSAYLDYYGDAILEPNTQYTFKCWAKQSGSGASVVAEIYDTNTLSVLATVTLAVPSAPGFVSGKFSAKTPVFMTATTVLRVRAIGNGASVVTIDELSCIFTENPYIDTKFSVSWINDPESVDDVTGLLGATADPTKIMDAGRMRDNFYFVTEERLHTTKDVEAEPASWEVNEVSSQCGACTMFSMIAGSSWLSWTGKDGARIFDGSQPVKITQDFQSIWDAINQDALTSIWAVNDSANRRIYWGVPISGVLTDKIYMLDYRYAERASEIEDRGAVRVSAFNGKMLVIELSRKFSPWTIPASAGGFLMASQGKVPAFSDAQGRTYTLDPNQYHDDDYGVIGGAANSYYVTSPFASEEMEQALQIGGTRHLYTFMSLFITGVGVVTITPLADDLTNNWPPRGPYKLLLNPNRPMEIPLNVSAGRCFFRISVSPVPPARNSVEISTDAAFNLSRMSVSLQPHPYSPIAGAFPGASGGYGSGGYGDNAFGS